MDKECTICHETKPITDFYTYTKKQCRSCSSIQQKAVREEKKAAKKAEEKIRDKKNKHNSKNSGDEMVYSQSNHRYKKNKHDDSSNEESSGDETVYSQSKHKDKKNTKQDDCDNSNNEESSGDEASRQLVRAHVHDEDSLETIVRIQGKLIRDLQRRVTALEQTILEMSVSNLAI